MSYLLSNFEDVDKGKPGLHRYEPVGQRHEEVNPDDVEDVLRATECPPSICQPSRQNTITGWIPSKYPNGHTYQPVETQSHHIFSREVCEARYRDAGTSGIVHTRGGKVVED